MGRSGESAMDEDTQAPKRLGRRTDISLRCDRPLLTDIVRTMEVASRVTAKGQVTIPASVRRALDLEPGDDVIFEVGVGPDTVRVQVRKAADFLALAGSVPVPAEWAGADWATIREAGWSARVERQADVAD
jgi:AbrB family looped-hinge helix DNA binding protein